MSDAIPRTARGGPLALLLAVTVALVIHGGVHRPTPAAAQEPNEPASAEPAPVDPVDPDAQVDPDTPVDDADPALDDADPALDESTGLVEEEAVDQEAVDAENRKMVVIVGGLVAVAFAILLLTIRYWRVTKPVPLDDARVRRAARDDRKPKRRIGRRSRRSIAGADHAGADDDWISRTTGEHEIDFDDQVTRQRPSRAARGDLFSSGS